MECVYIQAILVVFQLKKSAEFAAWEKEQWRELVKYPWQGFQDPLLRRQFKKYSILGTAALPEDKRARVSYPLN